MKRLGAILALTLLVMGSYYAQCVQALPIGTSYSRYDKMMKLHSQQKWLLPGTELSTDNRSRDFDYWRRLRPFANGVIAQNIEKVDLTMSGAFGPDRLTSREQARALAEIGILCSAGHFAVLAVNNDDNRHSAIAIVNQLADLTDHYKMGNLSSQFQRIATDVEDSRFTGGISPVTSRYDAAVLAIGDWVCNSYGVDGNWYFMIGEDWSGIYFLAMDRHDVNTSYFVDVLNTLYHDKPYLSPDYLTRCTLRDVVDEPGWDSPRLEAMSWSVVDHYVNNSQWFANPRLPGHVKSGDEIFIHRYQNMQ